MAASNYLNKLTGLEVAVLALGSILVLVMFTGGVSTMIEEIAGSFPIPKPMRYPVGAGLMLILAWCTKLLSKEFAEMCHDWQRYSLSYKLLLPTTTFGALILCLAVQSESVSIASQKEFNTQMASLAIDSANLKQIDLAIASTNAQLVQTERTLTRYEKIKAQRKGNWLREDEEQNFATAQQANQAATQLLADLSEQRIAETARLHQQISEAKQVLAQLEQEAKSKGRGKAGLIEGLMFFLMFFAVSYKKRFKPQTLDEQELIEELPKGLPIEQREQMLLQMKVISFDQANHHLLVQLSDQQYYIEIPKVIKDISGCKSRLDRQKGSPDTQLRNIAYNERILAMTPMSLPDLKRIYGYEAFNKDYWNNTTDNVGQHVDTTLPQRCKTASQRFPTLDSDIFS